MKYHLIYEKNGQHVPVLDEENKRVIDQGTSDAQLNEVYLNVPTNETNEQEKQKNVKKFRPFSTKLYNEILQQNIPTTTTKQTDKQENLKFKLPISEQYDPHNVNVIHKEERTYHKELSSKTENKRSNRKTIEENNVKEDIKETARKIITENLEKAIIKEEGHTKFKSDNKSIKSSSNITQTIKELKEDNQLNDNRLDESDIPKSVKGTVELYHSIDTKYEIKNEIKDERKLFLLQEIEESIEQGSVRKKSSIFENKTKSEQIKGRQIEKYGERKAFKIGSETIQRIKRIAETRLSKYSLKIFYLYLTSIMIKLTQYLPLQLYNTSRNERQDFVTELTEDLQRSIRRRKFSSADIVQMVSRKPKDLTQRMDTVISEFHSKLNIKNHIKVDNRRAKSVGRVEEVSKSNSWLSEMDKEERELMKEEIKLATLAAARRVLGRRRSYHNLTDIENEKVDGLTYIAIVESHVYTNKNAIFDDYISRLKTQVNDVLEITDVNEMVATEFVAGKTYRLSTNQTDLKDAYMKNIEDFESKKLCIEEGQRIDYVATVTVEHKQIPTSISREKDLQESELKQITTEVKELVIPTPIIEEIESTTEIKTNDATGVEITELNEELPIITVKTNELSKAQAKAKETLQEIETVTKETVENKMSYAVSNTTVIAPIVVEETERNVQQVTEVVAKEAVAVTEFTEANTLNITELKEEIPTFTIEEEKHNALVLNKETMRQTSEVYNQDIKEVMINNALEEKGILSKETEKVVATKMVSETYIPEEPTILPQIEVKSEISVESATEESNLVTAFSTGCGYLSELTTETDVADTTENIEVEKEIAPLKAKTNEFANAQVIAIATARQTSEVFDEVQNVEITELSEELPKVELEEEKLIKPVIYGKEVTRQISAVFKTVEEVFEKENEQEEKAIEVLQTNELATAYKLNYANIGEIRTLFNKLDIESFNFEIEEEFATSCSEIQEEHKIQILRNATATDVYTELEESNNFETETNKVEQGSSLDVVEEVVNLYAICYAIMEDLFTKVEEFEELTIDRIDQEVVTINREQELITTFAYCISTLNNIMVNLYEVNEFEIPSITEEIATENIETEIYTKAQSINTEISQDINILFDEVETITINLPTTEVADVKEVDKIFERVLPVATSCLAQEEINLITVDAFENEMIQIENALCKEEIRDYYTTQAISNSICYDIEINLEECSLFETDKLEEETPTLLIEEQIFVIALSICTSISTEIITTYNEADNLPKEDLQEDKAELSEEINNYYYAIAICKETSQNIDVVLEESNELIIENIMKESSSISTEPLVLERTFPLSTSILKQIYEELHETNNLDIINTETEEAKVLVEVSKLTIILSICVAAIENIYKDLEECNTFNIEETKEELCNLNEEPFVLVRILPICFSVLEHITTSYYSSEVLETKQFTEATAECSLEEKYFIKIPSICTSITETIITNLEEVNLFKTDEISKYQASEFSEPGIFFKTLPNCTATLLILNVPVFEIKPLEPEIFEGKTVSVTSEIKNLVTAQTLNQATIKQDEIAINEVENASISYKIEEDQANLSYEDTQLESTYAICSATSKQLNYKDHIAENYENNLEMERIQLTTESRDYKIAHSINNSTEINEFVKETLEHKEINKAVEASAVIKREPKHENIISIQEETISHDSDSKIKKIHKKRKMKAVSAIKDEIETVNIEEEILKEKSANIQSLEIEELKDVDAIHKHVTIIEQPEHLETKETVNIGRKKSIKQKASKTYDVSETIQNVIDVDSVTVDEPVIENINKSTSINIKQDKIINNEANVNISIHKAKAKKDENYQELSYNLTLIKPQVIGETVIETNEETVFAKREIDIKQHTEEFDEFNLNLHKDVESGVVIEEITDSDDNIDNIDDAENKDVSIDVSLEFDLQSQKQASKDIYEASTIKKRRSKVNNEEESAALTIFKKEDNEEDTHIIESYEADTSSNVMSAVSNARSEFVAKTEIVSQSSDIETKSSGISKKRVSKRISKDSQSFIGLKESHEKIIDNRSMDLEVKASGSQISTDASSDISVKTSLMAQKSAFVSQDSTIINKSKLSLKTDLKHEEIKETKMTEANESSPEIASPTEPPTPLTDEYIFRLVAPLPKSRGTTPVPREPTPENTKVTDNQSIIDKNLVPTIESVAIERVIYNPPLSTPSTSPIQSPTYTKPGLNGGMRLPRYFKPGLRGGSDRPPIPKEEILKVKKNLSALTSDINETLKNIEKYKKLVEILKQQKKEGESSKIMEDDNTDKQTKPEDTSDIREKESTEEVTEKPNKEPSVTKPTDEPDSQKDEFVDIKLNNEKTDVIKINIKDDLTNKIEEARIKGYDIKEVTSFEEIGKESDNIGIVELAPDTAGEESIEKEFKIIPEELESEEPETNVLVEKERDKEIEKPEDKVDDITDVEQKAADEEVSKVTQLTSDNKAIISPVNTTPSDAETIKEAHVISLTRVLSSHMIREGLSPDCQKMKDLFENKSNVDEKITEDRSWTNFLNKSTNLSTPKLGYFTDLQNKFEKQNFNSSPIPWQDRISADISEESKSTELTPGDAPQFFLAIPTESKDDVILKSTVIPISNTNQEIQFEIKKLNNKIEFNVDDIINEATKKLENLNIGEGKNRLKELLLTNIKSITDCKIPVDVQLDKIRSQINALDQVPDIIKETFEIVAEKLNLLEQKKEDTIQSDGAKYQKEELAPKETIITEVSTKEPQIIKEETKVEKMQAETKGQLLVKDKKAFSTQTQQKSHISSQPKFGCMNPEPRPIKFFGGRRWRRPGEEYTEEQIAETILAHSELIHGKTMGESNCHLVDFHNVQEKVIPTYNKLIEDKLHEIRKASYTPRPPTTLGSLQNDSQHEVKTSKVF